MKAGRKGIWSLALIGVTCSIIQGQQYNNIDAVTSASKDLSIKGGKAWADSAEITWNDAWSNGSAQILRWGVSATYGSQVNLKPFTDGTDVTTTLKGLLPSTKYYAEFFRSWEGHNVLTDLTFTTASANGVIFPQRQAVIRPLAKGAVLDVYTSAGRLVRAVPLIAPTFGNAPVSQFQNRLATGTYILVAKAGKNEAPFLTLKTAICR